MEERSYIFEMLMDSIILLFTFFVNYRPLAPVLVKPLPSFFG